MTAHGFHLPIEFDLAAVFLMALTGAWAGIQRRYDVVGTYALALVCGVGGGILRDGVFIQAGPPAVMQDARYLGAVVAAWFVALATHGLAARFERLLAFVDAMALGIYGVVGVDKALAAGFAPLAAVVVGCVNAIGGGIIRDILVRDEPLLLKPGQLYALAALAGCVLFVMLRVLYRIPTEQAAWLAIAFTTLLRVLAIRYNWSTGAVSDFKVRLPRGKR